jgi:hypothetical protein
MLNLRRGFRRLFLVLSIAWVVVSGFYLWRFPPPSPSSVDPDALAAELGGVAVGGDESALAAKFGGVPTDAAHGPETLSAEEWERRYKIRCGNLTKCSVS